MQPKYRRFFAPTCEIASRKRRLDGVSCRLSIPNFSPTLFRGLPATTPALSARPLRVCRPRSPFGPGLPKIEAAQQSGVTRTQGHTSRGCPWSCLLRRRAIRTEAFGKQDQDIRPKVRAPVRGFGGTRTHDQRLKRPLLYHLSYKPCAQRGHIRAERALPTMLSAERSTSHSQTGVRAFASQTPGSANRPCTAQDRAPDPSLT